MALQNTLTVIVFAHCVNCYTQCPKTTAQSKAGNTQNTRARLHGDAEALVEGGDAAGLPGLHDAVNKAVELARLALAHICTHMQGRSAMQQSAESRS